MSEQQELFDRWEGTWIGRTWRALSPARRREIVRLLGEMGRVAVVGHPPAGQAAEDEEGRHEP